jgi:hypothetical protein
MLELYLDNVKTLSESKEKEGDAQLILADCYER